MSRVPPDDPRPESSHDRDPEYLDWHVENEPDQRPLGTLTGESTPLLYDPDAGDVYRSELDEENERIVSSERADHGLDPEEELGEFLERVGEETGWDGLSSFARQHLEDDDEE